MMTERMTVNEYARYRGVSRQAVYKALAVGRITREDDGLVDVQAADRQWEESTDPLRGGPRAGSTDDERRDREAALGEQQARLARAAEVVPALAPWTGFINHAAGRASKIRDPEADEIRSDPLAMHELVYDVIANFLIDTGAADEERIDEADSIMFPLQPSQE